MDIGRSDSDEQWWDQVDLTKLILASNQLKELSEDIKYLVALTVLDVSFRLVWVERLCACVRVCVHVPVCVCPCLCACACAHMHIMCICV